MCVWAVRERKKQVVKENENKENGWIVEGKKKKEKSGLWISSG